MSEILLFPAPAHAPSIVRDPPAAPLSDSDAREAVLNIQRSWIVEAPAGSGKTGLLIQRYLKLLAHAEIYRPGEILVLTFTRKADGELRTRVLEQLTAALENQPLPETATTFDQHTREFALAVLARDRTRNWRLLDTPGQLNIRTIDSFCSELTATMPLLSGAGRLQPIDDPFSLYTQAAERTLDHLGGPDLKLNDALRTLLLHRDAQVADCLRLLTTMLAQREQWSELIPLDEPNLTDEYLDTVVRHRLERTLAHLVAGGLHRAADALGPENLAEIAHFAARLGTAPGYKENPNPLLCCTGLQGTLPTTADCLTHWKAVINLLLTGGNDWRRKPNSNHLKAEIQKADADWIVGFIDILRHRESDSQRTLLATLAAVRELPSPHYPDDQWRLVKALCRILSRALAELRAVFAQREQCDFTEIALTARALLAIDLPSTPAADLAHLLVDEMQDTSAGQYKLLESLTEFWDGASQTVFLVGDPKQSIYAFRQARVDRFLRTMDSGRLGELPLSPLRLSANFRSQASLVKAFNATFEPIFPPLNAIPTSAAPALGENASVPFIGATAIRTATTTPALHWHALQQASGAEHASVVPGLTTSSDQALQIRCRIEEFLAAWPCNPAADGRSSRAPKVAVLARNRAHLGAVLAELQIDRGFGPLPFRAVDVEPLRDRPEILDLLALTRALLHPADRVAWLAVLRSPVCGLTLADLLRLTGEGSGADREATVVHLIETRSHHLSSEGQALLRGVWSTLGAALSTLGSTPLSLHVERTWRSLGADAPLRPDQQINCVRFFDLLRTAESGPDPLSLALLNRHLQKLYAAPSTADTPIELMTIHKAKGLEWDLVLIPSIERGSGRNGQSLLKWLEIDNPSTDGDLLLAPIQCKGADASELTTWLSAGERRREAAEAQRLLYVACTRAREELHLFATVETRADGSLCAPQAKASLLNAAWPAARPILQQQIDSRHQPATTLAFPPNRSSETLALAASAASSNDLDGAPTSANAPRTTIHRLLPTFDPLARFQRPQTPILPYTPATHLRQRVPFTRPEGSFAARTFGNAVHRFLQLIADRLAEGQQLADLQAEVPAWNQRLVTTLRSGGLPLNAALAQADRALSALRNALTHPEGIWLLSPHRHARNEANLPDSSLTATLRADRTFYAGPMPLSGPGDTHLWIVDYKTAELGGRSLASFLDDQKEKYRPQLQAYADAAIAGGASPGRVLLALYFPTVPALSYWPASATAP